jgi:hypothetical protein
MGMAASNTVLCIHRDPAQLSWAVTDAGRQARIAEAKDDAKEAKENKN